MIVKLIKDFEINGKFLAKGREMDVTQEYAQELANDGYIDNPFKEKKTKKTKKNKASNEEQEIEL